MRVIPAEGQHRAVHSTASAPALAHGDPPGPASPRGAGRNASRGQTRHTGGCEVGPAPAHISSRILSMSGRRHSLFRNRSKISKEKSSGRMDSL